MTKECAHLNMEYESCGDGVVDWRCLDCFEVLEQFEDCVSGK